MAVRSRRGALGVVAGALALPFLGGCGPTGKWAGQTSGGPEASSSASPPPATVIVVNPVNGTKDTPVRDVTVTVMHGTFEDVVLTSPTGAAVQGEMSADRTSWTLGKTLGYGKTYTVKAVAVGPSGAKTEAASSFTTVKPGNLTLPYLTPGSPGTFGVGQPIVVRFDEKIKDRKAVLDALTVTTSPATEGAWRWFDDQELHWRPREYWAPGTKVAVQAAVYGVHFGNGLYGQENRQVSFTIGKSKIAVADSELKRMQVFVDGAMVKEFPVSLGKGGKVTYKNGVTVDYWTRTGPHVVMDKQQQVRMTSASYGVPAGTSNSYDSEIGYAVRISGAGEYVHLRDRDLARLGKDNDSHGCVNVGPGNAQWFFQNFGAGDIVEIKGGPIRLDPRDGLGDWVVPWSQWAN